MLSDLLVKKVAKATQFDKFYFKSNVEFLAEDIPTLSTTPLAYKLFLDLKENDDDHYILYLRYKEWSNSTKASRNHIWSNTFTICPNKGGNSWEKLLLHVALM